MDECFYGPGMGKWEMWQPEPPTRKIIFFIPCMPDKIVQEVRLLLLSTPFREVFYVNVFAKLQDLFGVEYSIDSHQKWINLVLPSLGNLRSTNILTQTRVTEAQMEVRDVSESASRILPTNRTSLIMYG